MIGIIDYGVGNLASVKNAFANIGRDSIVFDDPEHIMSFDRIILPGVGSFATAMELLNLRRWPAAIHRFFRTGRPILGICLGMQLLMEDGNEGGKAKGLGLISGEVITLQPNNKLRLPHVGWNSISINADHALFRGIKNHVDYYFVHSFQCVPRYKDDIVANCDYGGEFVAALSHGNVFGTQFHPEKSQPHGLRLLDNFAEWVT